MVASKDSTICRCAQTSRKLRHPVRLDQVDHGILQAFLDFKAYVDLLEVVIFQVVMDSRWRLVEMLRQGRLKVADRHTQVAQRVTWDLGRLG